MRAFCIIITLIIVIKVKVSHHSSVCPISSLLLRLLSQYKFLEGATSFDQPSIYCKWQEINNAFKDETNVCDGAITCGWGDDTNCPQPSIGGGGDPHYDMPNSQTLTVQALCELRVAASDNVYGSNLEMHTRHAEPQDQKAGKEYTVISHISLKLDDDVYELEGKSGNLYKNGELFDLDGHLGASTITAVVYILHHPEGREWWLAKARKEAEDTNVGNDIPLDQLRSSVTRCETRCGLTRTATRGKITYWCCLQL